MRSKEKKGKVKTRDRKLWSGRGREGEVEVKCVVGPREKKVR